MHYLKKSQEGIDALELKLQKVLCYCVGPCELWSFRRATLTTERLPSPRAGVGGWEGDTLVMVSVVLEFIKVFHFKSVINNMFLNYTFRNMS